MVHPNASPVPGDIVCDRYEIVDQLGVGGFGAVYRARQLNMNRDVALKTMLPHLASVEGIEERFAREAQLASGLVSPHTIRLYDFGKTPEGMLFIAMELLEGEELEDRIRKSGALSLADVHEMTLSILDSLAEAHQHQIVHRDLKPSNIFLTQVGRSRQFVKVLDFGIAKAVNEGGDQKLTATGQTLGTPYYMAPEQIRGKAIGPYSDIYALGLIMVEMATGQVAVKGETPLETVLFHVNDEPVPMPAWLAQSPLGPIIMRATAKSVQNRYQLAEHMIRDLEMVPVAALQGGAMAVGMQQGFRPETGRLSTMPDSGEVPQLQSGLMPAQSGLIPLHGMPGQPLSGMMPTTGMYGAPGYVSGQMPAGMYGQEQNTGGGIKILLAALVGLVLVGIGVFAVLFLMDGKGSDTKQTPKDQEAAAKEVPTETPATDNGTVVPAIEPIAPLPEEPTEVAGEGAPEKPPVAVEVEVEVAVASVPDGAYVYRGDEELGRTPLTLTLPSAEGTASLVLSLDGFDESTVEVDLAKGGAYAVTLDKRRHSRRSERRSAHEPTAQNTAKQPPPAEEKTKRRSLAVDDEEPKHKSRKSSLAVD